MARVVHFEIHAENPERAAAFYRKVFDWQIIKWNGPADYWLITTGLDSEPGINGAIVQRQGPINGDAVIAYVCTIDVADIDAAITNVRAQGGTEALPKWLCRALAGLPTSKILRVISSACCRLTTRRRKFLREAC